MIDRQEMIRYYTPEMVDVAMKIWMRSAVSLIDIRFRTIQRNSPLENYLLPANMFIYTHGAPVSILLNQEPYRTERYGLCHAGKGSLLSIAPVETDVDAFMILYKADAPPFYKRNLRKLMATVNPFNQLYGFAPTNPIFFVEKFHHMLESWNTKASMDQFYAKVLLYQVVHHVYVELKKGDIRYMEPDYVEWVKEYLNRHFTEPISLQALSDRLPINRSVLARMFRKRENSSMQEYLIKKRIEAAKAYLVETNASIQEVAYGSGFTDEFNMIRMFRRYVQVSPGEYRRKRSMNCINKDIDNNYQSLYNDGGLDDLVNYDRDGEYSMFGQLRNKQMIVAAALCLMLLLSACSAGTTTNNGSAASQTPIQTQQVKETSDGGNAAEKQTRIIKTVLGDVEVPTNPQRVVVQYLMGDVLSLGITPVGVSDAYEGAAFREMVSDSVSLGGVQSWDAESVMMLAPDLILVISEEDARKFSKIAPTVFIPHGEMTQDERVTFIGEVLNRQEEAVAAIQAYRSNLEQAKAKLANAGFDEYTASVFESIDDASMAVHGDKYGAGSIVYASLNLNAPEAVQTNILDNESYSEPVSFEVLPAYTGDFIVRNVFEGMVDLSGNAIWNSLPAVQNDRVIEMEFGLNYYSDIYSATAQINHVTDSLLQAIK